MNFLKLPLRPGFDRVNGVYYAFDLGDFPVFAIDPGACGMTMDEAEVVTNEIVQAVNVYDPIVAQRDALVAACRAARSSLSGFVHLDDLGDVQDAIKKCKTALALVKGDQKSDDADQD